MAEFGQVRKRDDSIIVFLPRPRQGPVPVLGGAWFEICPRNETLCAQLRALETGTVIDHRALLERGDVVVVRYPETRVTDAGFDRLLEAAELLEGHE